jgi:RNA recognition motif-containing protein
MSHNGKQVLYVNGLPLTLTDRQFGELFESFGTVLSARLIRNLDGESMGFGIIEMSRLEEVQEIINTNSHITIEGHHPMIWQPLVRP